MRRWIRRKTYHQRTLCRKKVRWKKMRRKNVRRRKVRSRKDHRKKERRRTFWKTLMNYVVELRCWNTLMNYVVEMWKTIFLSLGWTLGWLFSWGGHGVAWKLPGVAETQAGVAGVAQATPIVLRNKADDIERSSDSRFGGTVCRVGHPNNLALVPTL